jgi:hypothetical protein
MEQVAQLLFVVGLAAWMAWVIGRRYLNRDIPLKEHETREPPTESQLRWHIWNIRQDISMLSVTNFAILLVLVYGLILKG